MQQDVHQDAHDNDTLLVFCNTEEKQVHVHGYDVSELDPTFLKQNDWLEHPPVAIAEQALRNLLGRISRNPNDIYSMVKRVYLLKALNEKDELRNAVYDLLYCLGPRGQSLQKRILLSVRDILGQKDIDQLSKGVAALDKHQSEAIHKSAILLPGLWGETDIVNKDSQTSTTQAGLSPLDDARHLLDQGDIQKAISLLENGLLSSPHDKEISDELYLIYKHMRNEESLTHMLDQLANEDIAYREHWQNLIKEIQNEAKSS